jgi:hypothetical protein
MWITKRKRLTPTYANRNVRKIVWYVSHSWSVIVDGVVAFATCRISSEVMRDKCDGAIIFGNRHNLTDEEMRNVFVL